MLLVPEVDTLEYGLGDLSFHMIQGQVSASFFALCAVDIQ